jgi:hypothetical protein
VFINYRAGCRVSSADRQAAGYKNNMMEFHGAVTLLSPNPERKKRKEKR